MGRFEKRSGCGVGAEHLKGGNPQKKDILI